MEIGVGKGNQQITDHEGNANQKHNVSYHLTSWDDYYQKEKRLSVGDNIV